MTTPIDPQPETPAARPGVGVDQALSGMRVSGPGVLGGLERFRLGPAAAGALRAALDCLIGDDTGAAVQVMADESALEVRCTAVDPEGLVAAGGVIEAVEGNLAPTVAVPGSWSLRLPLLSARETFLMIERGGLPIALPWHAVTRVRMVTREGLAMLAAREGIPLASPLGLEVEDGGDRPAVLVGLGLRRAYVAADRLVWRMTAEPVEPSPSPPDPRLGPALQAGDDVFWLLDPGVALRAVPMPALPHAHEALTRALAALMPEPAGSTTDTPLAAPESHEPEARSAADVVVLEPDSISPLTEFDLEEPTEGRFAEDPVPVTGADTTDESAEEPTPMPRPWPALRLIELTPFDVDPFGDEDPLATSSETPEPRFDPAPVATSAVTAADLEPSPEPVRNATPEPAPEPVPSAAPEPVAAVAPRVLIAEDSITASIFLERLLEQRGFTVRVVGRASELFRALGAERWDLVLADVDLPDAHGAHWLGGLTGSRADGAPVPLVALVRDDDDATLAGSAGVRRMLRKPFEPADLDRLLLALDLGAGRRGR